MNIFEIENEIREKFYTKSKDNRTTMLELSGKIYKNYKGNKFEIKLRDIIDHMVVIDEEGNVCLPKIDRKTDEDLIIKYLSLSFILVKRDGNFFPIYIEENKKKIKPTISISNGYFWNQYNDNNHLIDIVDYDEFINLKKGLNALRSSVIKSLYRNDDLHQLLFEIVKKSCNSSDDSTNKIPKKINIIVA